MATRTVPKEPLTVGHTDSRDVVLPHSLARPDSFSTDLGLLLIGDCLPILKALPENTVDLVVTSPPYDGQAKYGNGDKYERDWYQGFFLEVTAELLRVLKPHGSLVLNYRSKRHKDERGTLQYELVFWLRDQGFFVLRRFRMGKALTSTRPLQPCLEGRRGVLVPVCKIVGVAVFPRSLPSSSSVGRKGSGAAQEASPKLCKSG